MREHKHVYAHIGYLICELSAAGSELISKPLNSSATSKSMHVFWANDNVEAQSDMVTTTSCIAGCIIV